MVLNSPALLRWVAFAGIVANVVIVVTGGAVRLTDSGLGCPTWPECTDGSLSTTPEMGIHGVIEYGNRLLSSVVSVIALAGVAVALIQRRRRPRTLRPAIAVLAGVAAQGVIGGITVLTGLNPWIVGGHFLVSMAILAAAYTFWRRTGEHDADPVPRALRSLAAVTLAVSVLVLVLGTLVTGSGPHAGDAESGRNGLDPEAAAQLHADAVFLLIGLSIGLWLALRTVGAATAARAAGVLVLVELSQGAIGLVQYFTNLPEVVVGVHMLGACLVWLATLAAFAAVRHGGTTPPPAQVRSTTTVDTPAAASRS
jgi:cytochrome c oxidase assembly protein subunit 15